MKHSKKEYKFILRLYSQGSQNMTVSGDLTAHFGFGASWNPTITIIYLVKSQHPSFYE